MVVNEALSYLELVIVSMLGSFIITTLVLLAIAVFFYYRKPSQKPEIQVDALPKNVEIEENAPMLKYVKTVFHFNNNAYIIGENDDSILNYTLMFRTSSEKLALKISDISIGGKTSSIKPHMDDLKDLFFRIQLNNNRTNSMINSEVYTFNSRIVINEAFLFSLKAFQLQATIVVIDLFVTLKTSDEHLMLGYVEIKLPPTVVEYPVDGSAVICEVSRPVDLYLTTFGYVCLCLDNIYNSIKLQLLASVHYDENIDHDNDLALFFIVRLKNHDYPESGQICHTSTKPLQPIIVWNEIFVFEIAKDLKENSGIDIELWETNSSGLITNQPPRVIGSVNLGLDGDYPIRSQLHWQYIMDNENKDSFRWHPIRKILTE